MYFAAQYWISHTKMTKFCQDKQHSRSRLKRARLELLLEPCHADYALVVEPRISIEVTTAEQSRAAPEASLASLPLRGILSANSSLLPPQLDQHHAPSPTETDYANSS